ncbi:MAG: hypothetical protein RLY31_1327 [Bacteroidota bacterium]|jgi:predicted amidohydrolase
MYLRVTTIQTDLVWENPGANLAVFDKLIAPLAGSTDLVVLPEMFTTGFTMQAGKLAEPMDGPTVRWMRRTAAALDAAVMGSFIATEDDKYFNRLTVSFPDGSLQTYDKRHRFALAGEHQVFAPGQNRLVFSWKGWKICPLICYDLRFPVWSRNTDFFDLLLYVANWPAPRRHHWQQLLLARAIENQCYVIGVNRCGTDANLLAYTGDTCLVDGAGQIRYLVADRPAVDTHSLDLETLRSYRRQFPFLADRDFFTIEAG